MKFGGLQHCLEVTDANKDSDIATIAKKVAVNLWDEIINYEHRYTTKKDFATAYKKKGSMEAAIIEKFYKQLHAAGVPKKGWVPVEGGGDEATPEVVKDTNIAAAATAAAASDSEEDFFDALEELDDDESATTIGWGEEVSNNKCPKVWVSTDYSN